MTHYDAIVIGAGQSGGPLSSALARAGLKTALIEREHVGGTCINEGCTPTKTMVASARVAYLARRAADYGVRIGAVEIDMRRVLQRKRDIVESFRSGSERRIEETPGLELIRGEARFTGPKRLAVATADGPVELTAERIFINTGARPDRPRIEGIEAVPTLDSTSIMELDEVPEHLLVLGGGYVGLEFGQMFRRFGSQVTVVQRGQRLLAREDADVAEAVADLLREDGIEVLLQTDAVRFEPGAGVRLVVRRKTASGYSTGRTCCSPWGACRIPMRSTLARRGSTSTSGGSCRRTSGSRRMCPASTPWATCAADRRLPTSRTTTIAC